MSLKHGYTYWKQSIFNLKSEKLNTAHRHE